MINTFFLSIVISQMLVVNDFIDTSVDCKYNGRVRKTLCNLYPAFEKAKAHCRTIVKDPLNTRLDCSYAVTDGEYSLSQSVIFCRQVELHGAGGWGDAPRTLIHTETGTTAIRWKSHGYCQSKGLGHGSNFSEIRDIGFASTLGSHPYPYYGMEMESRVMVERVNIRSYTQGIRITADARRTLISNANMWQLRDVRIHSCGHSGVYVDGGDTNVGLGYNLDATSNCFRASQWEKRLGKCANLVLSDFLGSTLLGAHTASAKDHTTGEIRQGYFFEGLNNRGLCLGCYAEGDQLPSEMPGTGLVIGGLSQWTNTSPTHQGWWIGGAIFRNSRDPNNIVELFVGNAAAGGSFWDARPWKLQPLRLKWESKRSSYRLDVANLDSGVSLRISGISPSYGLITTFKFPPQ